MIEFAEVFNRAAKTVVGERGIIGMIFSSALWTSLLITASLLLIFTHFYKKKLTGSGLIKMIIWMNIVCATGVFLHGMSREIESTRKAVTGSHEDLVEIVTGTDVAFTGTGVPVAPTTYTADDESHDKHTSDMSGGKSSRRSLDVKIEDLTAAAEEIIYR